MNLCDYCDGKMRVVSTIYNEDDDEFYRRKKCEKCGTEIVTVEFEIDDTEEFRRRWNKCKAIQNNRERFKREEQC